MALAAIVAAATAGCDLMISTATPRPSRPTLTAEPSVPSSPGPTDEVPTLRPDPAGDGPDFIDAANGLADLDSYRVFVASTGLVPSSSSDGRVTMTSTLVQSSDPAAEFTMVGVDGLAGGRLQAIVIGDQAWLKSGGGSWAKSPGGAADYDAAFTALSPIDLASGFEDLAPALVLVGAERRNGQSTTHYRVDATTGAAKAAGLTAGAADLWLASKGAYLVALDVAGSWDIDDTPTPIVLKIDVTHVNDPANAIKPPR